MSLLRTGWYRLTGWEKSDFSTYTSAYEEFGGSVCTHPDVLAFLSAAEGIDILYYCRKKQGVLTGASYSVNGSLNLYKSKYPIVFEDVLLPVSDKCNSWLPFNTKRLSPCHSRHFYNSLYSKYLKHKITYVKKDFSMRTKKKRNSELKKFLSSGGEIKNVHDFTVAEITSIYITLFKERWGDSIYCFTSKDLHNTLSALQHLLFGAILFKDGQPCAFDIIFKSDGESFTYFDDINGGYSSSCKTHNLGSILLWVNILQAKEYCLKNNKDMKFSLGAFEEYWSYKKQWCDIVPVGRTLIN